MNPAVIAALLPLIEAVLAQAPSLIADIEALVAKVKGQNVPAPTGPMAPQVLSDMAPALGALNTPISK